MVSRSFFCSRSASLTIDVRHLKRISFCICCTIYSEGDLFSRKCILPICKNKTLILSHTFTVLFKLYLFSDILLIFIVFMINMNQRNLICYRQGTRYNVLRCGSPVWGFQNCPVIRHLYCRYIII